MTGRVLNAKGIAGTLAVDARARQHDICAQRCPACACTKGFTVWCWRACISAIRAAFTEHTRPSDVSMLHATTVSPARIARATPLHLQRLMEDTLPHARPLVVSSWHEDLLRHAISDTSGRAGPAPEDGPYGPPRKPAWRLAWPRKCAADRVLRPA